MPPGWRRTDTRRRSAANMSAQAGSKARRDAVSIAARAPLTWQQVIISLQTVLDYPLTIGGRTALEQQGYAHYLSADMRDIHIYGPKPPPTWLDDLPLTTKFRWHNSRRLFRHRCIARRRKLHHCQRRQLYSLRNPLCQQGARHP